MAIKADANEKRAETFIVDAVWDKFGGVGDEKRDKGSGIGPVLKRAQQMGFIVSTGVAVRSQRGPTHGRQVTVWRAAEGDDTDSHGQISYLA